MTKKYKLPKIEELFEAGVHFGHQVRRWHPSMEKYIFTARGGIHIVDLEKTDLLLKEACEFMYGVAKKGDKVIFVGTKKQSKEIVQAEAERCGAHHVTERWLGGTITNFSVIKKNVDKLVALKEGKDKGEFEKYTKKERLLIDRQIAKLTIKVGGLLGLKKIPSAVFVVDPRREKTAVSEAKISEVPVAALVDTNCNPQRIDYPIPGNDDAIKSVALIMKAIADAVEAGYGAFAKSQEDLEKVEKKEAPKKNTSIKPKTEKKKVTKKKTGIKSKKKKEGKKNDKKS